MASSSTLSDAQIANIARQGGFPEKEIPTAVGVAKAESSGNPRTHNAKPPDNSYGLWQINMLGQMGPDRRKQFGISNNDALYDPIVNAKAAHQIWKDAGGSWRPWTTYTNGRYKALMNKDNNLGDPNVKPDEGSEGAVEGIGLAGGLTGILAEKYLGDRFAEFTEKSRVAAVTYLVFVVALVLLILGVVILNRASISKVASVIPAGKVAKIAKGLK